MLQSCPRALQGVERVVSGPEGTARISEEQTGRSEGWNLDQGPGQDAAAAQGERGAVANMPVQASGVTSGDSFAALMRVLMRSECEKALSLSRVHRGRTLKRILLMMFIYSI